ncbi:hypothetical protein AVEN_117328-1 [Araneus ventricosus]|uniref:Uncharacterized protein n=1 Tax=Araneus ventricosus TaxID=182803 RepID=A0A4Y2JH08_ARAVE|nr:hypothetical protein AVEN_117328-1 [Araneus ventricosus]
MLVGSSTLRDESPLPIAVSYGGEKGYSVCLSSMRPQHYSLRTETPVLYPKNVSAQHDRAYNNTPTVGPQVIEGLMRLQI